MCQSGSIYRLFLHVNPQPQHKSSYDFWQLCGLGIGCCRRDQFLPAGFLGDTCSVNTLCKQSREEKNLLILPVLQGKLRLAICSVLSFMMHSKISHPSSSRRSGNGDGPCRRTVTLACYTLSALSVPALRASA